MIGLDTFQGVLGASLVLAPVVTGLTTVIKMALNLQTTRYVPLIAVALGAILGALVVQTSVLGALVGVVIGLASTGLWELGKTTVAGMGVSSINQA